MKPVTIALLAAVFAAAFGGWMLVLRDAGAFPVPHLVAAVAALGPVLLAAGLLTRAKQGAERAALDREARGLPPRDGAFEAVSGPFALRGEPLLAPLTGRPCLAYHVEAGFQERSRDHTTRWVTAARGRGLAHGAIRSPARGEVLLLGWPGLAACEVERVPAPEARQRLEELLAQRGATSDEAAEPDGTRAFTHLLAEEKAILGDRTLDAREWIVPTGGELTAIGVWSEARGGLLAAQGVMERNVKLVPGSGDAVGTLLAGESRRQLRNAILLFVLLSLPALGLAAWRPAP